MNNMIDSSGTWGGITRCGSIQSNIAVNAHDFFHYLYLHVTPIQLST